MTDQVAENHSPLLDLVDFLATLQEDLETDITKVRTALDENKKVEDVKKGYLPSTSTLRSLREIFDISVQVLDPIKTAMRQIVETKRPIAVHDVDRIYGRARRIERSLKQPRMILAALEDTTSEELSNIDEEVESLQRSLLQELAHAVAQAHVLSNYLPRREVDRLNRSLDRATDAIEARLARLDTNRARDETQRVLEISKQAAGITGSNQLAIHFAAYAHSEYRAANLLRLTTVILIVAIVVMAGIALSGPPSNASAFVPQIPHLALSIPVAALAAYLAREAGKHRRNAEWGKRFEIQLLTLEAYIAPLPDDSKQKMREQLGERVFAASLEQHDDDPGSPSVVGDVGRLFSSIADTLKAAKPTEKP
ncbi:hypothetical protein [Amycolatopsis thermophila]|uniref:HPt (Histidine-containing phosphotransfer) domain-containing protein n=1 Tax=Amycolatopsis thermophila TaxID=206084 RepID=A0ABU0EMQ3_9PSEU|nr:hypothetical protein [Amycolatopsis thermophila]MDQ0376563.1 HPt (histidine-containing phosphotransfer) domain-containing protein [Amycolatopsis thermophila]